MQTVQSVSTNVSTRSFKIEVISILISVIRRGEDTVKCELKCFGKSEVITQSFNEKTLNIVPEFKVPHSALGNVTNFQN